MGDRYQGEIRAAAAARGIEPVPGRPDGVLDITAGRLGTLAEIRAATELGEQIPAVDLEGWAAGFVAGVDYAQATAGDQIRDEIAREAVLLDETDRVRGRVSRARRIAAEVAAGQARAVPVAAVDPDGLWPAVTTPGTGNLATLLDTYPCRCPRTDRKSVV